MGSVIYNNLSAMTILGENNKNNKALAKSLRKAASGMKINSAGDGASEYSISEGMRAQIRSLDQADVNAQNAQSLLRVAEGAVDSTVKVLRTLKEKAIDAANDTNTDADRAIIQKEIDQYVDQVEDNANVTFNGKILFDGAADRVPGAEAQIVKALNSEWLSLSLDKLKDDYGLSFESPTAKVKAMDVKFSHEGGDKLAYVTNWATLDGTCTKLTLTVNMDYYDTLKLDDVNGGTNTPGSGYLDRTIVHEMTHAVMASNIKGFSNLPAYIKEGMAETIHGIDDTRDIAGAKGHLAASLANTSNKASDLGGDNAYSAGYILLRYMAAHSGCADATDSTKQFLNVLVTNGAADLDNAVKAGSGGNFNSLTEMVDALKADVTAAGSDFNSFLTNSCKIKLGNPDTGSISGSDAGGPVDKTAESTVPEAGTTAMWTFPDGATTEIKGLTVTWPEVAKSIAGGLKFQIGTRAAQNIRMAFSDIHATALGLKDNENNVVSVQTREKAEAAIDVFDKAIDKVLEQATTIGAVINRMDYTSANLVTASENVTSAESVIRDADMAREMTEYTKSNVLMQAAQSMLSQANQNASGVLSLLQ